MMVAAVLASALGIGVLANRQDDVSRPDAARIVASPVPTTPPPAPSVSPTPSVSPGPNPRVRAAQQRLIDLGYWLPAATGFLDDHTLHAATALQKVAGLARTGVLDDATKAALREGVLPEPRSTQGRVVEIDRARQILTIAIDGKPHTVFDTSTGKPSTPTVGGTFSVFKQIDALRVSRLGRLWRPKYFYGGQAIHGFTSVPPYAASHGCVRLTYAAMNHVWDTDLIPVGTAVWIS